MTTITKLPDGGAAFARNEIWNPDWHEIASVGQTGMSLRDYFAAHCPSDICRTDHRGAAGKFVGRPFPETGTIEEQAQWNVDVESKMRYQYADAMLKAKVAQ